MKSTFKKQRRGSKKNKSQRKGKKYTMKGGVGKFFTGTYKGITKICPEDKGPNGEKCLYIVPKILEKGITGTGFWNKNTWENINKAVDDNLNGKMIEYFDGEELTKQANELGMLNPPPPPAQRSSSGAEDDDDEELVKIGGKKRHRKQKKSRKYRK